MLRIPFILLLAISCFSGRLQQEEPKTQIEISYVDNSIRTRDHIDCSSFETVFAKKIKKKKIESGSEKTRFIRELDGLEKREDKFPLNARAQIIITTENGTEIICADHHSVYRNGVVYLITPKIRNTIWKQT